MDEDYENYLEECWWEEKLRQAIEKYKVMPSYEDDYYISYEGLLREMELN